MKNRNDAALSRALRDRLDALEIPPPNLERIGARVSAPVPRYPQWRRHGIAFAAGVAIGVVVMARFWGTGPDGKTERLVYKPTTLEQARHDLPFPVVTPAVLPAGFHLQSVAIGADQSVHLVFGKDDSALEAAPGIHVTERASAIADQLAGDTGAAGVRRPDGKSLVSSFTVGNTHVNASFIDLDNSRSVARAFKASMIPHGANPR